MPRDGYTPMFPRMLDAPENHPPAGHRLSPLSSARWRLDRLIFTGPIDEFFGYRYGQLPYRSLRFRHETLDQEWFQAGGHGELSLTTRSLHPDYRIQAPDRPGPPRRPASPTNFQAADGDPYYPVPRPENPAIYKQYQALADADARTSASSAGWRPIATLIWTKSSARRSPSVFRRIEEEAAWPRRAGSAIDRAPAAGPADEYGRVAPGLPLAGSSGGRPPCASVSLRRAAAHKGWLGLVPARDERPLFASFFLGGFECSAHRQTRQPAARSDGLDPPRPPSLPEDYRRRPLHRPHHPRRACAGT